MPVASLARFRLLRLVLAGSVFWALACGAGGKDGKPGLFGDKDVDDDGYPWDEDCDDENPDVHPGASEICDPVDLDEDCDGKSDNADTDLVGSIEAHRDSDGDGYGLDEAIALCELVAGYAYGWGDCDDTNPAIHPDGQEVCDPEQMDEDCDGLVDDADPSVDTAGFLTLYVDDDRDGFGDAPTQACHPSEGVATHDGDCNDADAGVSPAGTEVCGGEDEDCDGAVDEGDAADAQTWYDDVDEDRYGNAATGQDACEAPSGTVADATDCDDRAADVYPGADETCDDEDDDCDGAIDEDAIDPSTWYADTDSDGYGDRGDTTEACDLPRGYVANASDCEDGDAAVNPGESEVCDAADTDEDCDGNADDYDNSTGGAGRSPWYADDDGDGYGAPSPRYSLCDAHPGFVTDNTDCDDVHASAHPGASEVCDSVDVDEDCDGPADDADAGVDRSTMSHWYADADRDGYGDASLSTTQCNAPASYVGNDNDCDDTTAGRSPGRPEVCDAANVDEDCDGLADDDDSAASGRTTWHRDGDGDAWGDPAATISRCDLAAGYAADGTDCDDGDATISPGTEEVCFDTIDQDCDGATRCDISNVDADQTIYGDAAYDSSMGFHVGDAGDVNGDGIHDLLIGDMNDSEGDVTAGKAFLVLGGQSGDLDLPDAAQAVFLGESSWIYLGCSGTGVGDVTGDGVPDVAIGAYRSFQGSVPTGAVFLHSGATTGTVTSSRSTAWAQLIGSGYEENVGYALAAIDDQDGDGLTELLVGASGRTVGGTGGGAYLVGSYTAGVVNLSLATAILEGEVSGDGAGGAVADAGDTDGDGLSDLLVGASGARGEAAGSGVAYLLLGPTSGTIDLAAADARFTGTGASDAAGMTVAGKADTNGDGYVDIAIGAPDGGSYGKVYVIEGPVASQSLRTADATLTGTTGRFGLALTFQGDLDGDGLSDLSVGNNADDTYTGRVSVFLGPVAGAMDDTASSVSIVGTARYDSLGASVLYVPSAADSAISDLWFGVPGDDTRGEYVGAVAQLRGGGL